MRLLFHDAKNQIGIHAILRAVLSDQTVDSSVARSPAALFFGRRVGFGQAFQVFTLNTIHSSAVNEDRKRAASIPNSGGRLGRAVSFDARPALRYIQTGCSSGLVVSVRAQSTFGHLRRSSRILNCSLDCFHSIARNQMTDTTYAVPNSLFTLPGFINRNAGCHP